MSENLAAEAEQAKLTATVEPMDATDAVPAELAPEETPAKPVRRWGRRRVLIAAGVAGVLALGGAGIAVADRHHSVELEVDGVTRPVSGFNSNVSDVLAAAGVKLGAHDEVAPAKNTAVKDGSRVVVRTGREIEILDGEAARTVWTTGRTDQSVLTDLAESGRGVTILASRSAERPALPVLEQAGTVEVVGDGKTVQVPLTAGKTAYDVLSDQGFTAGKLDRVQVLRSGPLMRVQLVRIVERQRTETVAIAHTTTETKDAEMALGEKKVETKGVDGKLERVVFERLVDGKVVKTELRSQKRVTEPVTAVVKVGTNKDAAPAPDSGADLGTAPSGTVWARLAQCESGGNPRAVSSSGTYHGLYQFTVSTWRSVGGSGLPSQASAAEQTKRAQMLQARSGWGQWPACSRRIGVR